MLFTFTHPTASAGCFPVYHIPKDIFIPRTYPLIPKKPGFYEFLRVVTKFYRKNPVSEYPHVNPIYSLTPHFIGAEYHLSEVASFLTEEK